MDADLLTYENNTSSEKGNRYNHREYLAVKRHGDHFDGQSDGIFKEIRRLILYGLQFSFLAIITSSLFWALTLHHDAENCFNNHNEKSQYHSINPDNPVIFTYTPQCNASCRLLSYYSYLNDLFDSSKSTQNISSSGDSLIPKSSDTPNLLSFYNWFGDVATQVIFNALIVQFISPKHSRLLIFLTCSLWLTIALICFLAELWILASLSFCNAATEFIHFFNLNLRVGFHISIY
jgi:hypothetical protein